MAWTCGQESLRLRQDLHAARDLACSLEALAAPAWEGAAQPEQAAQLFGAAAWAQGQAQTPEQIHANIGRAVRSLQAAFAAGTPPSTPTRSVV